MLEDSVNVICSDYKNDCIISVISVIRVSAPLAPVLFILVYNLQGCLRPANERRYYFVAMSLIGWVQAPGAGLKSALIWQGYYVTDPVKKLKYVLQHCVVFQVFNYFW